MLRLIFFQLQRHQQREGPVQTLRSSAKIGSFGFNSVAYVILLFRLTPTLVNTKFSFSSTCTSWRSSTRYSPSCSNFLKHRHFPASAGLDVNAIAPPQPHSCLDCYSINLPSSISKISPRDVAIGMACHPGFYYQQAANLLSKRRAAYQVPAPPSPPHHLSSSSFPPPKGRLQQRFHTLSSTCIRFLPILLLCRPHEQRQRGPRYPSRCKNQCVFVTSCSIQWHCRRAPHRPRSRQRHPARGP
jgi:hypothetical protein